MYMYVQRILESIIYLARAVSFYYSPGYHVGVHTCRQGWCHLLAGAVSSSWQLHGEGYMQAGLVPPASWSCVFFMAAAWGGIHAGRAGATC